MAALTRTSHVVAANGTSAGDHTRRGSPYGINGEISEVIEEEAIELGLGPREVEGLIEELTEESQVRENIETLRDHYGSEPLPIEELELVVKGEQPVKQGKDLKFREGPKAAAIQN